MAKNEELTDYKEAEVTSSDAYSMAEMLRMAWRAKYWIILSIIICMAAAYYGYKRHAKYYGANAEVMLIFGNDESSAASNALRNIADMTGIQTEGKVNFYNELEVMRSPELLTSVVEKLNLTTVYTTEGFGHEIDLYGDSPVNVNFLSLEPDSTASLRLYKTGTGKLIATNFVLNGKPQKSAPLRIIPGTVVETPIGMLGISATASFDSFPKYVDVNKESVKAVANRLAGKIITTKKDKDNTVVIINYEDVSQQRAVDIINGLIKAYNDLWVNEQTRSAATTSNFINERLAIIEKELSNIDSNISHVKSRSQVADIPSAASSYYGQTLNYDTRAFEANTQLQIATYLRDYINDSSNKESLIPSNTGTSGAIESQIQEYNKLLVKRDQLLQNSSDNNPVIAQMNSDLVKNRALINSSLNNIISTYQIEVNRAQGRKGEFSGKVSAMPQQEQQILSIERQQKVKENLYIYLLQKREENELNRMVEVNNTRILHAAYGLGTDTTALFKALLIGFVIGLALPLIIIFIILKMDTKVSRKTDLAGLSIPFLGEMPMSQSRRSLKRFIRHLFNPGSRKVTDRELKLVVRDRSRSYINEAFRMLRTNLDFLSHSNSGCEVIMLTSFNPGSGKTFIAVNLAKSLQLKGKKVLIIDMDMRRASLSNFAGNPAQGISFYLTGMTSDIDKLIRINNRKTGLDVLPVGAIPPNPVELVLSNRFQDVIASLRQKYDYIILDCPPYDLVADTALISRVADVTLFVVRAGLFNKSDIKDLEDIYQENKLPHMAIILNGINPKDSYYHHRYGYSTKSSNGYYIMDDEKKDHKSAYVETTDETNSDF
ncbi:MAG: polysaccharide biosynthesis tyrosine autokinase [Muribaculaceae bacterium]|nr:polysaccharide biosynthesis tyrosine autokinase [Muribaculaceae bacterium]